MKKIILGLFSTIILSLSVNAQKINTEKVPAAVTTAFQSKFTFATKVKWEMENKTEYEASFDMNGAEMSANFDSYGNWLETETEIKTTTLPIAVLAQLKSDFAGYKIEEASKIESTKNGTCYEAEIEKGLEKYDVLFTVDGKVISKSQIEKKEKKKQVEKVNKSVKKEIAK